MSDDRLESLKRFTPEGGLDRDELLFSAGRASAPSAGRAWAVVALLSLTQALTLTSWLPRPAEVSPPRPLPSLAAPAYPGGPTLSRELPDSEAPTPEADLLPAAPPLRPADLGSYTSF